MKVKEHQFIRRYQRENIAGLVRHVSATEG